MRPADISIATITWARDENEAPLILDAVATLAAAGMPVAISDGGSPPHVVATLAAIPQVSMVPPRERGLVHQVQASVTAAAAQARPFILYTESDKRQFLEQSLAAFLSAAPDDEKVGIVLASRTEAAFGQNVDGLVLASTGQAAQ